MLRFKHLSKTALTPSLRFSSSIMLPSDPICNEDITCSSKRINKEKLSLSQRSLTSTTNLPEDVMHAAKPIMMTNSSEKRTKKKNNSPWFSNATKKNATASTIQKNPMIITGRQHVTPCKPVEKAYVCLNYDTDKEDKVDGIKISSLTKESKNDTSTAKNKASTGKSKVATNKKKPMIRKNKKRMKCPHHKDHLKMIIIGLIK